MTLRLLSLSFSLRANDPAVAMELADMRRSAFVLS